MFGLMGVVRDTTIDYWVSLGQGMGSLRSYKGKGMVIHGNPQ